MKKLEECLLLLERGISLDERFSDEEKIIECLNQANNYNQFGKFFLGYSFLKKHEEKLRNTVMLSKNEELKEAYNNFLKRNEISNGKIYYYYSSLERRLKLLNNTLDYINNIGVNNDFFKKHKWSIIPKKISFYKDSEKLYNARYIINYFNSNKVSKEEKELFNQILEKIGGVGNFPSYINSDKKTKLLYLKKLLEKVNNCTDKKFPQKDIAKHLHFYYIVENGSGKPAIGSFKKIKEYFNSNVCSEEEKELFNQILEGTNSNVSKAEDVLYDKLNEIILPLFKNKVEIITQGHIDTKDKNGYQTVDILIKFKDGYKKYNGKNILGIAIEANGELYHKYSYILRNSNITKAKYPRRNATDSKRFDSLKYEVRQWDERDISDVSKKLEDKAESFIKQEIVPILNSVFNGDRPIDDSKTQARQAQYQRLAEIGGGALTEKVKLFDFNGLKINNLPRYFLINKKNLIYNKLQNGEMRINEKNLEIWNKILNPDFIPDELWKKQIYQAIVRNENFLKRNNIKKGSIEYINKIYKEPKTEKQVEKMKKGQPNLNNFNYERSSNRKERQFAKLFKEIKKNL